MVGTQVFAGLFFFVFAVAAQHPDRPTGQTGREGVETKPDAVYDTWVVSPGHVEVSGHGYDGSYDWNSPPQSVGAEGFVLNLSVTCQTENGQRFATGIGISSVHFKLEPTHEVPCNAAINDSQSGALDIRATPPQQSSPGTEILIKVGAFWGLGVTYKYRAR